MGLLSVLLYVLLGLVALVYIFLRRRFSYWADRNVPHAPGSFPLGSLNEMGTKLHMNDILDRAYQQHKQVSPVAGFYMSLNPVLLVTSLDLVKQILVKDFNIFRDRGMYVNEKDDPLSGHLFAVDGERWRFLRNKLSPTFTSGKIKYMFATMQEVGDELAQCLDGHAQNDTPAEVKPLCQRFTCDVIGSCAFGLNCNSLKNKGSQMLTLGERIFKPSRLEAMWMMFLMSFKKLSTMLKLSIIPKDVSKYFMNVVEETVSHREKNNVLRQDFLQLLLQLKNHGSIEGESQDSTTLSMNEVAAQSFVFFVAGFETTSTALSFAMLELAINTDIQQKAREEINRVLTAHNNRLDYESLKDMHYLEQVVNETLRLYPPVNMLHRCASTPYKVPSSDITIEKDTMLIVPVFSIHRDPEIYPDPTRFDPDRFTPEAVSGRHSHSFIPFGDGPRNCIGMRFALLEVKFGIAQLLRRFSFSPNERMVLPLEINIKEAMIEARGGIWLDVTRI